MRRIRNRFLFVTALLMVWLIPGLARAQAPLLLTEAQGEYPLGLHLELLEDPTTRLTLEEVAAPPYKEQFKPSQERTPNFGYTRSAIWARLQMETTCSTCAEWLLEVADSTLDSVDIYLLAPPANTPILSQHSGNLRPFTSRDVDHRNFVFELPLEPGQPYTLYLRVQHRGSMSLLLTLWSPTAFARHNNAIQFGFGFYYGFIFIMIGYNLFLFFFLREKSYLYYVLFISSLGLFQLSLDGFARYYIWPEAIWWSGTAHLFFIGLALLTGLHFASHFLATRVYAPRLDKVLNGLKLLLIGLIGLSLWPPAYHFVAVTQSLFTVVVAPLGLVIGHIPWRQGYRPARYYLLAWSGVFAGAMLIAFGYFGLLPIGFLTDYGLRIGVFFLILFLALALVDRINVLKAEAEAARQHLEETVEQRTNELAGANRRLQEDIDQLQQAEDKIGQQNKFLNTIIEALASPFYVVNVADYTIEIANSAARAMGIMDRAVCYAHAHGRSSPCDDQEHPCPVGIVKRSKKPAVVEHIHCGPDGQPIQVEVHGYPIFNEAGEVVQMIEYSINISQRKQAEEDLRKLSRAVEQSGSTIVITDLAGIIEFVNPAFSQITGYTYQEAIGQNPNILKSGKHSPEVYRELWETIKRGEVWQGELINRKKNGELYWEFATISPVKDKAGQTTHYLAIKDDITARKQAEETLQATMTELEQRVDELSTLNLIIQTIATVTDLHVALRIVAGTMTRLFNASGASIALLNPARIEATVVAEHSRNPGAFSAMDRTFAVSGYPAAVQVIETGRSLVVSEAQTNPSTGPVRQIMQARHVQGLLLVPFFARGEVLGFIGIETDRAEHEFSPSEITLAETIAGQIAGAIENSRLFHEEQRLRQTAESLRQVATILNSSLDSQTIVNKILEQLHLVIPYDSAGLFLREGDDLVLTGGVGLEESFLGHRLPLTSPNPTTRPVTEKKPVVVGDVQTDLGWRANWPGEDIVGRRVRGWIGVPLLTGDEIIGVLTVDSFTPHTYSQEDGQLLQTFANQATIALENARLFDQIQTANRRMQEELTLAREIQQSLLPPPYPNWSSPEVTCYSSPAREVGGDFYRYQRCGSAEIGYRYAFAVGDVSGKGVSAALLMAASLSQFDAILCQDFTPTERMAYLDRTIAPYTKPRRQNCAMCYVELTLPTDTGPGQAQIINAGCIPPFIRRANGRVAFPEIGGLALGQELGSAEGYHQLTLEITSGDLLILTSDGVVEAINTSKDILGFERLEKMVKTGPADSAEAMLKHLKQQLSAFIGPAEQRDDLTVMVIRV